MDTRGAVYEYSAIPVMKFSSYSGRKQIQEAKQAKRESKMRTLQTQFWTALLFTTLVRLGAALPTNDNANAMEERGVLEPRACAGDNCLRALRAFDNAHAATTFCGDYIPKGVYTTIVTTQFIFESLQQFSPTITKDYTSTYTYTNFVTIGLGVPIFPPAPTPTASSGGLITPAPTPTPSAFLNACSSDSKKISSACSCIISSVTTVLQIENYYIEDIFPYDGPPFQKRREIWK